MFINAPLFTLKAGFLSSSWFLFTHVLLSPGPYIASLVVGVYYVKGWGVCSSCWGQGFCVHFRLLVSCCFLRIVWNSLSQCVVFSDTMVTVLCVVGCACGTLPRGSTWNFHICINNKYCQHFALMNDVLAAVMR